MRMERGEEPIYLGHSAASAEVFLLRMDEGTKTKRRRKRTAA
ncbi:MAG: hypothetical protein ACHP7A_06435 [Caulobacterales bacterium]